jgi:hypothetical protein
MNVNEILDNLDLPVNRVARQTILDTPSQPWVPGSTWEENRPRELLAAQKREAKQVNEVLSKREALGKLAEMIEAFKERVSIDADSIREFAKNNDIDNMLDWCPWDTWSVDPILESTDPLESAVKWMHSDHSC